MKKLILILLIGLFTTTIASSQNENWKRLGLFTASIALDAAGDALMDDGTKKLGHLCNAASVATTISIPFILDVDKENWLGYLASYTFIRFAVFDYTYNGVRGLPFGYTGNTSHYDKMMQKVPNGFELWSKSIVLSVGLHINFDKL
jgi:hypothetical protein